MSDDPWFTYKSESGRFRAAPANWKGWFTFVGGLALTIALGIQVMSMTEGYSFATRIIGLNEVILAGVGAICLVAFRNGRPSR